MLVDGATLAQAFFNRMPFVVVDPRFGLGEQRGHATLGRSIVLRMSPHGIKECASAGLVAGPLSAWPVLWPSQTGCSIDTRLWVHVFHCRHWCQRVSCQIRFNGQWLMSLTHLGKNIPSSSPTGSSSFGGLLFFTHPSAGRSRRAFN